MRWYQLYILRICKIWRKWNIWREWTRFTILCCQKAQARHKLIRFELNLTNSISIEYESRINWGILSLIRPLEILGVCLANVGPAPHPHHRLDTLPGRAQVADSKPILYPNFTQIGSGLILYPTRLRSLLMKDRSSEKWLHNLPIWPHVAFK